MYHPELLEESLIRMAIAFVSTPAALWFKGLPHIWIKIKTGRAKIIFAIKHFPCEVHFYQNGY